MMKTLLAIALAVVAVPPAATAAKGFAVHQDNAVPQLLVPGDSVQVGYSTDSSGVKSLGGTLFVRTDLQRRFSPLALAGKGHIATYIVIEDGRLRRRMPDQPYNLAMVALDEDPTINFYSNLPGTPPYEVPVGAAVEVTFEEVAPGQLIHEWRVL